jgi:hypothetical protein
MWLCFSKFCWLLQLTCIHLFLFRLFLWTWKTWALKHLPGICMYLWDVVNLRGCFWSYLFTFSLHEYSSWHVVSVLLKVFWCFFCFHSVSFTQWLLLSMARLARQILWFLTKSRLCGEAKSSVHFSRSIVRSVHVVEHRVLTDVFIQCQSEK